MYIYSYVYNTHKHTNVYICVHLFVLMHSISFCSLCYCMSLFPRAFCLSSFFLFLSPAFSLFPLFVSLLLAHVWMYIISGLIKKAMNRDTLAPCCASCTSEGMAMAGHAAPLKIIEPLFCTKTITQSTFFPCMANSKTIQMMF